MVIESVLAPGAIDAHLAGRAADGVEVGA